MSRRPLEAPQVGPGPRISWNLQVAPALVVAYLLRSIRCRRSQSSARDRHTHSSPCLMGNCASDGSRSGARTHRPLALGLTAAGSWHPRLLHASPTLGFRNANPPAECECLLLV